MYQWVFITKLNGNKPGPNKVKVKLTEIYVSYMIVVITSIK